MGLLGYRNCQREEVNRKQGVAEGLETLTPEPEETTLRETPTRTTVCRIDNSLANIRAPPGLPAFLIASPDPLWGTTGVG